MFGSAMLEVAIGIIFIFLLVSIICSTIREGIEAWFKTRAAYLEYGIRELLQQKLRTAPQKSGDDHENALAEESGDENGLVRSFYEHPLIYGLFSGPYEPGTTGKKPPLLASGNNLPSYIPAKNFAVALMDIAARGPRTDAVSSHPGSPVISLESVRANILNVGSPFVQRALLTALDSAQGSLERAQKNIEAWYDSAMDRVSGWYKRSTSWILFWIGLAVAVGFNINTVVIADYLYKNDDVRRAVVAKAEAAAKDTATLNLKYDQAKSELASLDLPIGWSNGYNANPPATPEEKGWWTDFWAVGLGWLLTAFAATFGAPFWFDLLNKVMVIRSTVKPHEKSPEESSEDRQTGKGQAPAVLNVQQPADAPPPVGPPPQPVLFQAVPTPRDAESSVDGCDVEMEADDFTPDEDLPPSEGGEDTANVQP